MFSQGDFPANRLVLPGSEKARRMTAISGQSFCVLYPKSPQLGLLVKMLVESQRWSNPAVYLQWKVSPLYSKRITHFVDIDSSKPSPLNEFAKILKTQDIPSNRCLFRLVPLAHHTEETGSSSSDTEMQTLLKTPCAADSWSDRLESKGVNGTSGTLAQEVVSGYAEKHRGLLIPTPIARCWREGSTAERKDTGKVRENGQLLPTPIASDYRTRGMNSRQQGLSEMIHKSLSTPTAHCFRDGTAKQHPKVKRHWNIEEYLARMVLQGGGRWQGFPTVSPVHRRNDGFPFDVDDLAISFNKWRDESIKAYGNAIVPQVMFEIFRAINMVENNNN